MKSSAKALLIGLLVLGFASVLASAQAVQGIVPHEGTIYLEGKTLFDVYAEKVHQVIIDPHSFWLKCTADLVFLNKQDFVLHTTESMVFADGSEMVYRMISFSGKMSPAGELKYTWPDSWWELGETHSNVLAQMRDHMGYEFSGQGVNKGTLEYYGYFDGNRFFADFHILGFQVAPGSMPPYDIVVEGPIKVNFLIDLNVVD